MKSTGRRKPSSRRRAASAQRETQASAARPAVVVSSGEAVAEVTAPDDALRPAPENRSEAVLDDWLFNDVPAGDLANQEGAAYVVYDEYVRELDRVPVLRDLVAASQRILLADFRQGQRPNVRKAPRPDLYALRETAVGAHEALYCEYASPESKVAKRSKRKGRRARKAKK